MKSTDYAYLAGLIDGDGSFVWSWDNSTIKCVVQVTHEGVINHLVATHGGKVGTVRRNNVSPRTTNRSRDIYTWRAGAKLLRTLLPELNQYMIIKKRHGEVLLEALQLRAPGSYAPGHETFERQRQLYEELRRLNDRTLPGELSEVE